MAGGRRRCSSPTCWPRRATESRWRTGSRGATRSSTTAFTRTLGRLPAAEKLDGCATRSRCASSPRAAPAEIAARAQAALPRAGGDAVLRRRRARVGRGGAVAGGARRDRHLGRRSASTACCAAAAPAGRPGSARAWRCRRPVDPALARAFVGGASPAIPPRPPSHGSESTAPDEQSRARLHERRPRSDVRNEMRAFIEENFLYLHPDVELADDDDFLDARDRRLARVRRAGRGGPGALRRSRSRTSRSPRRTSARSTPSSRYVERKRAGRERPHARRGPAAPRPRADPDSAGRRRRGSDA